MEKQIDRYKGAFGLIRASFDVATGLARLFFALAFTGVMLFLLSGIVVAVGALIGSL